MLNQSILQLISDIYHVSHKNIAQSSQVFSNLKPNKSFQQQKLLIFASN